MKNETIANEQSFCDRLANQPRVVDRALHHFVEGFLDHHLVAVVTADDGVRRLLDVADLLGVDDKRLAVETGEGDHPDLER